MSQDLGHHHHHHHHSVFSFPITGHQQQEEDHIEQHHHIAQQIRRDKLRLQAFQPTPLLAINADADDDEDHTPVYEATGMLSEMFNFPSSAAAGATHFLHHHQAEAAAISSDSAMQLFLMNPAAAQTRSALPNNNTSMLLPANSNPNDLLNPSSSLQQGAGFRMGYGADNPPTLHSGPPPTTTATGYVEGQGLSLSLSSNMLHHLYTNNHFGQPPPPQPAAEAAATAGYSSPVHVAYGSSLGAVNVLRNSRYLKAAQELLEEFCSVVGRSGQFKTTKQLASASAGGGGGGGGRSNPNNNNAAAASSNNNSSSSSTSKDTPPPLLAADRMEHQRRKVKLLAMLDEVEGRYKHYCEEMQMVVNTFELVMGLGAAVAYTALAEKAMSRHFRCLKDAISSQLKHSCELLGETVISSSTSAAGITKGETPRLKMLDHTLRQQRAAFHQLDHDAWRPQRGLPDRSVTILRAWLFDHFLHPYPSDADKHLLARQTGLSRNQVSNWFINARVRLWKPMVEEMYQQEAKEDSSNNDDYYNSNNNNNQEQEDEDEDEEERESSRRNRNPSRKSNSTSPHNAQIPTPDHEKRCHNGSESDPSFVSGNHPPSNSSSEAAVVVVNHHHQQMSATGLGGSSSSGGVIRFGGPISGDVSLTLGLRHPGNNYATPPPPPPHNYNHNHNIITTTTATSFSLTDHFRAS